MPSVQHVRQSTPHAFAVLGPLDFKPTMARCLVVWAPSPKRSCTPKLNAGYQPYLLPTKFLSAPISSLSFRRDAHAGGRALDI